MTGPCGKTDGIEQLKRKMVDAASYLLTGHDWHV